MDHALSCFIRVNLISMLQFSSSPNSSHAARLARVITLTLVLVFVGGMAARQLWGVPTPIATAPSPVADAPTPIATSYEPCSTGVDGLTWSSDSRFVEGFPSNNAVDACPTTAHFFKSDGTPVELTEAQRALSFDPPYRLNAANESFMGLIGRDGRVIELQSAGKFESGFDHDAGLQWLIDGQTLSSDAREFYAVYQGVFYAWQCESGKMLRRARLFKPQDGVGEWVELAPDGKRALWQRRDLRFGANQSRVQLLDTRNGTTLLVFGGPAPDYPSMSFGFADEGRLVWSQVEQSAAQKRRHLFEVRDENARVLWSRTDGSFNVGVLGARFWFGQQKNITLCEARTGRVLKRLQVDENLRSFVPAPDASRAWGMTRNGEIRRYPLLSPSK